LRAAVRYVNRTLAESRIRQNADKALVGRISRGFDFLGYPQEIAGLLAIV